jgi:hypothetical protein
MPQETFLFVVTGDREAHGDLAQRKRDEVLELGIAMTRGMQSHQAPSSLRTHRGHGILSAPSKLGNVLFLLVPQEGFEPPTPSLRMTCSTG